ncbi:hypothetical protein GCM10020369_72690 [Cryptosporangium minutisporangium]|uniref:HTH araC/xylS-type domain-containing protein n=2 Tax=Cryptosporangium minutisporangium TaxID=113569 RepID=A0ABP6T932_9ACTN
MSWGTDLLRARLMRAMALLTLPAPSGGDRGDSGFTDVSAFARAFGQNCGESPSAYRVRLTA